MAVKYHEWSVLHGRKDMAGSDLKDANLACGKFSHVDLSASDLSHAKLYLADLSYADLSRSVLRGADLAEANLTRANLCGADLRDANLSYTILTNALYDSHTVFPAGYTIPEDASFVVMERGSVNVEDTLEDAEIVEETVDATDDGERVIITLNGQEIGVPRGTQVITNGVTISFTVPTR